MDSPPTLRWALSFLVLLFYFSPVFAQNSTSDSDSYDSDPILQYRPSFAKSLPVQILLTGVVLTLVVVLFVHLIFTAQYHWKLAQVNYVLQISAVTTLLISLVATIHVVFSATVQESQHWPYMLSYLAVDMPSYVTPNSTVNPNDPTTIYAHQWTLAERATWIVMNATTSGLIQITHIHFLTLLFPSHLEARLIFGLLGPLAIISAVMQLIPIYYDTSLVSLVNDVRNVCNATLSLLFTLALLIWGLLVNRRQAWRTDGGTAAFGAGAISLAIISTTLNFLYIPSQDQYVWMPKLMWAVVLWQSFLGWWWWVGAGMGIGEVEELMRREEKRERKRKLRAQKRKEQREKAKSVWKGMTGAFRHEKGEDDVNRSPGERPEDARPLSRSQSAVASLNPSRSIQSSLGSSTASTSGQLGGNMAGGFVQRVYAKVRHAHITAARIQAVERVERLHQVWEESRNDERQATWGRGNYGMRGPDRERRQTVDNTMDIEEEEEEEEEESMKTKLPRVRDRRRRRSSVVELDGHRQEPQGEDQDQDTTAQERSWSSSVWWWAPLRQWRLQDSTAYR